MAAHQREWSDTDLKTVHQLLTEHATFKQIGLRFGVSKAAVGGVVSRNGLNGISQHRTIAKPKPTATAQRTANFFRILARASILTLLLAAR
jgi:hypothetical protein